MAIHVARAFQAKEGQAEQLRDALKKSLSGTKGALYQNMGNPAQFGVFAEFDDESAIENYIASHAEHDAMLAELVEGAADVTAWQKV